MKIGDRVTLRGISGHGKNRVERDGDTWIIRNRLEDSSGKFWFLEATENQPLQAIIMLRLALMKRRPYTLSM